jgi:hypothetical protein
MVTCKVAKGRQRCSIPLVDKKGLAAFGFAERDKHR